MKWFVCGDIHSFYDIWMDALSKAGFDINDPDHHIILLGDLLDRGDQSLECLEFVCSLIDQNRIICIMGNHEMLLNDIGIYSHGWFSSYDKHNGTDKTVYSLANGDPSNIPENVAINKALVNPLWKKYFDECNKHFYYETDKYIFVHSSIPDNVDNWRDIISCQTAWINDAIWRNPFRDWAIRGYKGVDDKVVVFGHWNTSWAYSVYRGYDKEFLEKIETMWTDEDGVTHPTECHDIFYDEGIIGLDACTVHNHVVNILVLEEL